MLRMVSLTTTQRDLLRQLLAAEGPASALALGAQLHLTPRQVQYGLREIKAWLGRRHLTLRHTPGVGIELLGEPERKHALLTELSVPVRMQLILTPDQRQQLLMFSLLNAAAPVVLGQFQQDLAVARATVLRDLEVAEGWLRPFALSVARRQHRGCWVSGSELSQRQALLALLWGSLPCERPLTSVGPGPTVLFALAQDAALLPVVTAVNGFLAELNLSEAAAAVATVEAALGGHFNEDTLDWLVLAVALQLRRVAGGHYAAWEPGAQTWAQTQLLWPVATQLGAAFWPRLQERDRLAETAALTAQLCANPRDDLWRADLERDPALRALVTRLQQQIAQHYGLPELRDDEQLRAGLAAHLPPASVRQRFGLWSPPRAADPSEADPAEQALVQRIGAATQRALGAALPPDAEAELALLLRAAVVRARPERARRVLVVCPSGMATTQLLVARLRARLPRLGTFEVLTMRALTAERIGDADLIISTVPLALAANITVPVVQVHPMLRSEDIAALTQWLA